MKTAGILDSLLYAPFSALAAAITAPGEHRGKATAIGALLGSGMATLAQREYEERKARGEAVSSTDFNPLFRSVLTGLATGGGARVLRDVQSREGISAASAVLAGAPIGALAMDSPLVGAGFGATGGLVASKLTKPNRPERNEGDRTPLSHQDINRLRVQRALERARYRIEMLRRWQDHTPPGSPSRH